MEIIHTFAHHLKKRQRLPMRSKLAIVAIIGLLVLFFGGVSLSDNNEPITYNNQEAYQFFRIKEVGPNFCGEELPFTNDEVRTRYEKQLGVYTYHRHSTEILLKRANRWFPTIEKIIKENGLPEDFKYLALIESNLTNVTSRRGAGGFWQFVPRTGRYFGLRIDNELDERLNPIAATEAACRYFKKSQDGLNTSWTNVAASYNMGVYGMKKRIKQQGTDDYYSLKLNKETTGYLYKIAVLKEIYEHQEKYGFDCHDEVKVYSNNVVESTVNKNIEDLESFAYSRGMSMNQLRKLNPWLVGNSLSSSKKQAVRLILPEGHLHARVSKSHAKDIVLNTSKLTLREELAYGY